MANRLLRETSPYLLQHAHNPVDWFPWGPEALDRALAEQKLILVSIGYSACHWCHVMERESFEDPSTAEFMNSHFVNIKIDREERPDLDHIYMDAVQALSGSGGWPLNVFLTPDAKPFYGGTYFPPVRAYNRSSWKEVLAGIVQAWTDKPQEILAQAENLTDHIRKSNFFGKVPEGPSPAFHEEDLLALCQNLLKTADEEEGGFGRAPKFPQTFSIKLLLRQFHYLKKKSREAENLPFEPEALLNQALLSLDKMIFGGIYDQLQGGFARYSTDNEWLAPHFEKMLYDNALLVDVLSEAWQLTRKPLYKETIEQTMVFIIQEWVDSDGGCFSALDADSEGEEGKFYVWSKGEVEELLGNQEWSQLYCAFYDISEKGNWEGKSILRRKEPLEAFCNQRNINYQETRRKIEAANMVLLQARNKRVKPQLDDKKLMGWNALMITSACKSWQAIGRDEYLDFAISAANFIEDSLKDENGNYHHNTKDGRAANPAFIDDLAWYVEALCLLQECTGKRSYLELAASVTESIILSFSDEESPYFYYTPAFQQDIIVRKKDTYDGATPSGNSIMAINLAYLGTLLDRPEWKDRAAQMAGQLKEAIIKYPGSFGVWALVAQWMVYGWKEIAVVGDGALELSKQVLQVFIPGKVFQFAVEADASFPLLTERKAAPGQTFIFVCEHFSCKKPVVSIPELITIL